MSERGDAPDRLSASNEDRTLIGRLVGVTGRADLSGVTIWFTYRPVDAELVTVEAVSGSEGDFLFDLPSPPVIEARVGALIEGVMPIDLEPIEGHLEPGELVLVVDDIIASHQRFA